MDIRSAKRILPLHAYDMTNWKCHMFTYYLGQSWIEWERNYTKINKSHQGPSSIIFVARHVDVALMDVA